VVTWTYAEVLARFGHARSDPTRARAGGRRTRYEMAGARLEYALGDLLGVVLAVDPAAGPDGCC